MSGAGRGAKFKKYYEQSPVASITTNIVTHVGTGHRLANLAVAPILPPGRRSEVGAGSWSVGEFLALERKQEEVPVEEEIKLPHFNGKCRENSVVVFSGRKIVGEKRADSVETDDLENISVDSTAEVLEDHFDFGCDYNSDSSEDEEGSELEKMMGVMKVGGEGKKRVLGRGRGRPRYIPVIF